MSFCQQKQNNANTLQCWADTFKPLLQVGKSGDKRSVSQTSASSVAVILRIAPQVPSWGQDVRAALFY